MEGFSFTADSIFGLVLSEAVREIGKNIGQAIADLLKSTVKFISNQFQTYFYSVEEPIAYQY